MMELLGILLPIPAAKNASFSKSASLGLMLAGQNAVGAVVSADNGVTWESTDLMGNGSATTMSRFSETTGVWIAVSTTIPVESGGQLMVVTGHVLLFLAPGTFKAVEVDGAGKFVICSSVGEIYSSTDGTTWTARTSGVASALNFIKWCLKRVTMGQRSVLQVLCLASPDGTTWTSSTSNTTNAFSVWVDYNPHT
jgi:hypothetical protein